jgi:diaminohydroxyphosphoribosylaminopyrimidine deaminase / 5-amino-6-(5-phosphoribosylamino)uracil reductase
VDGAHGEVSFFLKKNHGLRLNLVQAMQMACEQATLGLEQTTPNPCVGAVILDSNEAVIGLGHHKKFGGPHAEIEALHSLSQAESSEEEVLVSMQDSLMVVTLEPCAHEGKTPSCAKGIAGLAHQISKVVYLIKDPNPKVSGEGHKILEAAGIKTYCVEDILKKQKLDQPDDVLKIIYKNKSVFKKLIKEQKYLNRQFLFAMNSEIPYVTLKWAQTLDGTIGLKEQRLLITNSEVQSEVHHLRACHDIILVGKNTVLLDNPFLNNRIGSSKHKLNTIAILDSKLEVLSQMEKLKIFETHSKKNLIFITQTDVDTNKYEAMGFQFIKVSVDSNKELNLKESLVNLKKNFKINSVFVEGGQAVQKSLLRQKIFNEIYIYMAFRVIFKTSTLRINYFLWMGYLGFYLNRFKFKTVGDNILLHLYKR